MKNQDSLKKKYFEDFLKTGRIGKQYYVFGAPEDLKGPYDHPNEAEEALNKILNNHDKFEVVNRVVVHKEEK